MIKGEIHKLASEIDKGYEIRQKIKDLEKELNSIKSKLRDAASKENPDLLSTGEVVKLQGNKYSAKICLSEDSFSFAEHVSLTDMRRAKAMLSKESLKFKEDVKLKEGVDLKRVKRELGDTYFNFFEDDLNAKFDAREVTAWMKQRKKMARIDNSVDFLEGLVVRKINTPKVTFSK